MSQAHDRQQTNNIKPLRNTSAIIARHKRDRSGTEVRIERQKYRLFIILLNIINKISCAKNIPANAPFLAPTSANSGDIWPLTFSLTTKNQARHKRDATATEARQKREMSAKNFVRLTFY
jgi:hypothetical protein